jgi:hypothetical protein
MPSDPKECRQHGLRCTELAANAPDPQSEGRPKTARRAMAEMAVELERAHALRDELELKAKKR